MKFHSIAEMHRYQELKLLEKAGEITDLVLQPKFEVVPKTEHERAATYTADFQYKEKHSSSLSPNGYVYKDVVEDVKSEATAKDKTYILNRKLFRQKYPDFEFREIL